MDIQISNESAEHASAIHDVTVKAFTNAAHTDHTEQFIVAALRRAGALTVSQVAKVDGEIIGHVAISPITLSTETSGWFGLGPISVVPDYQRLGVGTKLMNSALDALKAMGASGCVVLGDPMYYQRFGFRVIDGLVYPGVPEEYFLGKGFQA